MDSCGRQKVTKWGLRAPWLVLVLCLLCLPGAHAQSCGPTLTTITIDGEFDDWVPVLSNIANVSLDADGFPSLCPGSDLDCPVNAGLLDFKTFAYTWDQNNLYLYVEFYRDGIGFFHLFLDLDNDQFFTAGGGNTGDKVLQIQVGNSSITDAFLSNFDSGSAIPMADQGNLTCGPGGDEACADGYALNLTGAVLSTAVNYGSCSTCLSADNLKMEFVLPWADLGVSAGTPLAWHLSSGTTALPDPSITDNMGATGGGAASSGFSCFSLGPDHEGAGRESTLVNYGHQVQNEGTLDATINLTLESAQGYSQALYTDPDGDGNPADGALMALDLNGDRDFSDPGDVAPTTYDSDFDGLPDTGLLAGGDGITPGGAFDVVLQVDLPAGSSGTSETGTLYGTPSTGAQEQSAVDLTHVGLMALFPDRAGSVSAGTATTWVPLAHSLQNAGALADTMSITLTPTLGWSTNLYTDPDCNGDRSDGTLLGASVNVPGDSTLCLVLEVGVPASTPAGQVETVTFQVESGNVPGETAAVTDTVTVAARLVMVEDNTQANGQLRYSGPGNAVFFPHKLTNNFSATDTFLMSHLSDQGFAGTLFTDPDCDGNPADGMEIPSSTSTPPVGPFGGTLCVVLKVEVGSAVAIGTLDTTTLYAFSDSSPTTFASVVDQTLVSSVASFEEPTFTLQETQFGPCDEVFMKGNSLLAGLLDRFQFEVENPSGTVVYFETVDTDSQGNAYSSYSFASGDSPGTWTLRLNTCSGLYNVMGSCGGSESLVDEISISLILQGTVQTVSTGQAQYDQFGQTFSGEAGISNDSLAGELVDTRVEFVVLTPDESQYLQADGTFTSYTGSEVTKASNPMTLTAASTGQAALAVAGVSYPYASAGYILRANWRTSCGELIHSLDQTFEVISSCPSSQPAEVTGLTVTLSGADRVLAWDNMGLDGCSTYSVKRASTLAPTAGTDFADVTGGTGLTALTFTDTEAVGDVTYLVVIESTSGGTGTWGHFGQ